MPSADGRKNKTVSAQPVADIDVEHLVQDHGIDRALLLVRPSGSRQARRHLTLFYEMKHSADHAQRKVGHDHA